jgi:uncharacterized membrane protein
MATEDTACYRPFNHLKFFAGPLIAALLVSAHRFIYLRSPDPYAKSMIWILCITFLLASIGVHVGCLLAYIDRHRSYKYRPTIVSAIVVSLIQILMFASLVLLLGRFFALPVHK